MWLGPMDSSSPVKRRKTSPLNSVVVDASNTPSLTPSRNNGITAGSRASFLSPTKASLARSNPGLLPPPRSVERVLQKQRSNGLAEFGQKAPRGRPRTVYVGGDRTNGTDKPTTPAERQEEDIDTRDEPTSTGVGTIAPVRKSQGLGGGIFAAPRRRSSTTGGTSPAKEINAPKDTVIRASPPEEVPETQDVAQKTIDGQLDQELQGSAGRRSARISEARQRIDVSASTNPDDPELPPTPTQLGLEAPPEPPKGILYSPSRRPLRKKSAGVKSSPLKPREPAPEVHVSDPMRTSNHIQVVIRPSGDKTQPNVEDPEVLQKQEIRDELLAQLQKLREDVALCEDEIERAKNSDILPDTDDEVVKHLMYVNILLRCIDY